MTGRRTLRLRKESLTELTPSDLRGVVGATYTTSFEMCPTWWCTPVLGAVQETVRRVTAETSANTCA
jgi:hypothetical protein